MKCLNAMVRTKALFSGILIALLWIGSQATIAQAATYTSNWGAVGSGQWTDAANWDTVDYPHNNGVDTYDVNTGSAAITITLDGDVAPTVSVEKLTLGTSSNSSPLVLQGIGTTSPTVTVNDALDWNRASLTGTGTLIASQGIQFNPAGNYWASNSNSWDIELWADSDYAPYPSTTISDNRNFTNTGTITAKSGITLAMTSRRQIKGAGTFVIENGAILTFASPFASPNSLGIENTLNNAGTVKVLNTVNSASLSFSGGGTHAGGDFEVPTNTSLTLNGTHTITNGSITGAGNVNLQNVSLDAGSLYNVTGNTTITGTSSFSGATTFQNLTMQNGGSAAEIGGTGNILVDGDLLFGGTGRGARFTGSGTVTVMGDFTFGSNSYSNYEIAADRTLELHGNSTFAVYPTTVNLHDNGYQMDMDGTIINKSGATWTMLQTTRPMRGDGTFINEAGAIFQKTAGTDTVNKIPTFRPAFENAGTVTNSSGTLHFLDDVAPFSQTAGRLIVNNAPFILDGVANITGGTIEGVGTLTAVVDAVTDGGTGLTISPGMSIGALNILGSVTLDSNDTIAIEIANGTSFDTLDVSGTLNLNDASLDLSFLDGFAASGLDELVIINAGNLSGTFANAPAGLFDNGFYGYQLSYSSTQVTLSNFSQIPEPSSLLLVGMGMLLVHCRRKRSCSGTLIE